MTRSLFRPWIGSQFDKRRSCGNRAKRPPARCSSCWRVSKRDAEDSGVTTTWSGVPS